MWLRRPRRRRARPRRGGGKAGKAGSRSGIFRLKKPSDSGASRCAAGIIFQAWSRRGSMHAIRTLKNLVITPCRSAAPAGFRHPGIGPIKKVKSRTFLLDSYPENARAAKCSIAQLAPPCPDLPPDSLIPPVISPILPSSLISPPSRPRPTPRTISVPFA